MLGILIGAEYLSFLNMHLKDLRLIFHKVEDFEKDPFQELILGILFSLSSLIQLLFLNLSGLALYIVFPTLPVYLLYTIF